MKLLYLVLALLGTASARVIPTFVSGVVASKDPHTALDASLPETGIEEDVL